MRPVTPAAALPLDAGPAVHGLSLQQCHDALRTRDADHDGRFFVGVTSTGVYCRPVCRVRTPRVQNCRFFELAAQAEAAGFRPCLRCRPELAPGRRHWSTQDAGSILARQAAHWLDTWQAGHEADTGMTAVAQRLGISDRHLRRVFESYWGISPVQYRQTRRLLMAKQLLSDTQLPVTQVASLSGFASLRRFNDAFHTHYRLTPSALRRTRPGATRPGTWPDPRLDAWPTLDLQDSATLRLDYRPPLDVQAMLAFWRQRLLQGVEAAGDDWLARTLEVRASGSSSPVHKGWLVCRFDRQHPRLALTVSASLVAVLPAVVQAVRAAFDLDADVRSINAVLHPHFPAGDGLRVPGAFDGFEVAVRAILGQQVSVAAARTLAQRLVDRFGGHLRLPAPELMQPLAADSGRRALRLFPRAQLLAQASGDALGALGIVRQRQAAIVALAQAVSQGDLCLEPMTGDAAGLQRTLQCLRELPGVGEWTVQYLAMRVLRDPDALPASDVALHRALGLRGVRQAARLAAEAARAWTPWRSYAVIRAWHQRHDTPDKATP